MLNSMSGPAVLQPCCRPVHWYCVSERLGYGSGSKLVWRSVDARRARGGAARVLYFCKDDEMALVELDKESTLFKAEWQVVLLI